MNENDVYDKDRVHRTLLSSYKCRDKRCLLCNNFDLDTMARNNALEWTDGRWKCKKCQQSIDVNVDMEDPTSVAMRHMLKCVGGAWFTAQQVAQIVKAFDVPAQMISVNISKEIMEANVNMIIESMRRYQ